MFDKGREKVRQMYQCLPSQCTVRRRLRQTCLLFQAAGEPPPANGTGWSAGYDPCMRQMSGGYALQHEVSYAFSVMKISKNRSG